MARDAVGSPGRDLRHQGLMVGPGEKLEWQEALRSQEFLELMLGVLMFSYRARIEPQEFWHLA